MNPRNRIIPLFLPFAGCKQACVFCDQKSITGAAVLPPGEIEAKARRALAESGGTPELAYYGGSFTAMDRGLMRAYLDVAARLYTEGLITGVRFSTRPDCIDTAVTDMLSAYPVTAAELGAQSMDATVLRLAKRGHTPEDTERAARLLRTASIPCVLQMMAGLPGDSRALCADTARRLAALRPAGVRIYPVAVFPGTELHRMWRAGTYTALTEDEAVAYAALAAGVFIAADIPILRIGLHAGEALSLACAGARHPALGERVRSRIYLERARAALAAAGGAGDAVLYVYTAHIPLMTGQRRENIRALESELGIRLRVRGESREPWSVRVERQGP